MSNPIKQFTTDLNVCYNFSVKKFTALTTVFFTAIGSLFGVSAVGFAEVAPEYQTEPYPAEFTANLPFESVTDYAVGEGTVAYAENSNMYVHEGDNLAIYEIGKTITSLDYAEGRYLLLCGTESFSLPPVAGANGKVESFELTSVQHVFSFPEYLSVGGGSYHLFNSGTLRYYVNNDESTEVEVTGADGGFTKLKQYGGKAYAMCGNLLYEINGSSAVTVKSTYTDFTSTQTMPTGDTEELLKTRRGELNFVTLKDGYFTQIDLNQSNLGEYFKLADKHTAATKKSNGETALLLCSTGNANIVSVGGKTYITAAANCIPARNDATQAVTRSEYVKTPCAVYSVPYVSASTQIASLEANVKVQVVATLSQQGVLEYDFYEIETYDEAGNKTGTGYVMSGFLSPYGFEDGNDPSEITDPNYSEDDEIKTVVIVLVVIALALTAVAYLFFSVFKGKGKKKKGSEDN